MERSVFADNPYFQEHILPRERGRGLPHACILSGPAGSGRHALANMMAAAMVCTAPEGERPCGRCVPCRKAVQGIHPDISTVTGPREGRPITVDQIRTLRSDAYIRPNEGERKVYLLEGADQMNPSAQNAMLKLLEEGPPYAAFLLLADNPGGLLQTVRSRCEEISLRSSSQRPDREPDGRVQQLADALERKSEEALFQASMELDRGKKEELIPLLEELEEELGKRLARNPSRRLVRAVELVRRLRQAALLNANSGQLAGWLCAGMFL